MNDNVRQQLTQLVQQYGVTLCQDRLRLEGLLRDSCGEHKLEIKLLTEAVHEGICDELLRISDTEVNVLALTNLIRRLMEHRGISGENAKWAVESWVTALGKTVTTAAPIIPNTIRGEAGYVLCKDLHDEPNGCEQPIPQGREWKFCPVCGRCTGHISVYDGRFNLPFGKAETRVLTILNKGQAEVPIIISLSAEVLGVRFKELKTNKVVAKQSSSLPLRIDIPPLHKSGKIGTLKILAEDATLDPEGDPWQKRQPRELSISLYAEVERPAIVNLRQECAIFRERVSERAIYLINEGDATALIRDINVPQGYEIVQGGTRVIPGHNDHNGETIFKVRRRWEYPAEAESELLFTLANDQVLKVRLFCPIVSNGRSLMHAVVGIDFGTAFTSVAFRECKHNRRRQDTVVFWGHDGWGRANGGKRFPTRIWIGRNGEMEFGDQATLKYNEDVTAGFLFREIKTLLREDRDDLIYPERQDLRNEAKQMVEEQFEESWRQALVSAYLGWLRRDVIRPEIIRRFGTPDAAIKYVFSLPVLDYASSKELYKQQLSEMEECVRQAGYPLEDVEFQFEPVCATLGLLYPPMADWPRLGSINQPIRSGDAIAVFDSGGGTTDVVLAMADVHGNEADIRLSIERCLGVVSAAKTFGGELVTTRLMGALKHPVSIEARDWYRGPLNFYEALKIPIPDAETEEIDFNIDQRDHAEQLKMELAKSSSQGVERQNQEGTEFRILPKLLTYMVRTELESLAGELRKTVFNQIKSVNVAYYMCVGGNTYLPPIERWVQLFMDDKNPQTSNRRLPIPEEFRKLAVAYGAVWVPDARIRNAVPYHVEVLYNAASIFRLERNTSQEVYRRKPPPKELLPQEKVSLQITASLSGEPPYQVDTACIQNPYDVTSILDIVIDVQNGVLRVKNLIRNPDADVDDASQEPHQEPPSLMEYQL